MNANLVTSTPSGAAGSITLNGTNTYFSPGTGLSIWSTIQSFNKGQDSAITVASGVQIVGGNVTITSTAGAETENTPANPVWASVASGLSKALASVVNMFTALPISVVIRQPTASIDISGTIQSTGTVDVESKATASAIGEACLTAVNTLLSSTSYGQDSSGGFVVGIAASSAIT